MAMFRDEILKAHTVTWYVWAGGVKMRRTASMRGTWGYDATCKCGWESKTGGATRRSVEDDVFMHRLDAQITADTMLTPCPDRECTGTEGQPCTYKGEVLEYLHPVRWMAAMNDGQPCE